MLNDIIMMYANWFCDVADQFGIFTVLMACLGFAAFMYVIIWAIVTLGEALFKEEKKES